MAISDDEILWPCGDCATELGELHKDGCDVERCPRCGGQFISCRCIYEIHGMNWNTLQRDHPDIYRDGPTAEMEARYDKEWGARRMPWTGHWPGDSEASEYGISLNDLHTLCRWDVELQRWIRR